MLDVAVRPIAFRSDIVALVEEHVEASRTIPLFCFRVLDVQDLLRLDRDLIF
jgi:hypothetical protein